MSLLKSNYSIKPLKGLSIRANSGSFGTVSGGEVRATSLNVDGFIEDGVISNITLQDSTLINCNIGVIGSPNTGTFSELNTTQDVNFFGTGLGNGVFWDYLNNEFNITGELHINGCTYLDNIEICVNTISATNLNGDILVKPNNLGSIFMFGGIIHNATTGNYQSNIVNGSSTILTRDNLTLTSSQQNVLVTSSKDQLFNTLNGSFIVNTENITRKNISLIDNTNGNLRVTTLLPNNIRSGDIITLTSNLFNGQFTVGNVVSSTSFILGTVGSFANITAGNFIKQANNDIGLFASRQVSFSDNIPIFLGSVSNLKNVGTTGIIINSVSDIQFTSNKLDSLISIPQTTQLQFGNSSGNSIVLTSIGNLNVNANQSINFQSSQVNFNDPILHIANYNTPDLKDRGIEYNWYDTVSNTNKLGWFGWKKNTNLLTFIPDATNNNEIITGAVGDFAIRNISAETITLSPGGNFDVNCGSLINVNTLTGCGNTLNISSANINTIGANFNITAGNVNLNALTKLNFDNNNYIVSSNGNLTVKSTNFVVSSSNVLLPNNSFVLFGSAGNFITSNTNNNLIISSSQPTLLNTTQVVLPNVTPIVFGNTSNTITGSGGNLILTSNVITLNSTTSNINANELLLNTIITRNPGTLIFASTGNANNIQVSNGNFNITGNSVGNLNFIDFKNIQIPENTLLSFSTNANINFNNSLNITNTTSNIVINGLNTIITTSNLNITNGTNGNMFITTGNFVLNAGSTQINSDLSVSDPIITIGNSTNLLLDKGIIFQNTLGNSFFGVSNSTNRFTYYSNAINTNGVISGTIGSIEVANLYLNNQIIFNGPGFIDLNCGIIDRVNTINSCSGVLNINAASRMNITSSNINLSQNAHLNFGNTNNYISGDTNGNLILTNNGSFIINSNVIITGTTSNVFSTITNLQDPIFSIGGVTGPIIDDSKDRGIEFKWNSAGISKTGFFGYKNALGRFVFIRDGINNNEIYSGAYSDVQFGNAFVNNIDLNNGTISNVNVISSNDSLTLNNSTLNIISKDVYFTSNNIWIPTNTPLHLGQNTLSSDTNGNLIVNTLNDTIINSTRGILLNANDFVSIPTETLLNIGNSNLVYTSNNLVVTNTFGNIDLIPNGSINIPLNTPINFGSTDNNILSDGTELSLNGYNGISLNSSTVTISGNVIITGIFSASNVDIDFNTYILPLGTIQALAITSITNTTSSGTLLVTVSDPHNYSIGDSVFIKNTNSDPIVDATYPVNSIVSGTQFTILHSDLIMPSTSGVAQSNLMTNQNKDVGIQVNYWSTTGNFSTVTAGSVNYKTGFFGFENLSERWTFYSNALITQSNVINGTLGNIEVNEIFANKLNTVTLTGNFIGNTQLISGTNFDINGGAIDSTPIGVDSASSGRFTNLSNTLSSSLNNLTLTSSVAYSIDRYTMISGSQDTRNPDNTKILSLFKVSGNNYTNSSGTMGSVSLPDGFVKIISCAQIGTNSKYTLHFNNLIAPNSLDPSTQPSKVIFKRQGQSIKLIYDAIDNKWILISANAYIS